LEHVAGIHSILLNEQPIAGVSPERSFYEIGLDHSRDRNSLVLEIEPLVPGVEPDEAGAEWGEVALVIRSINTLE